jgi:uncharacterized protein YrzB (UPF0473 family)
MADEKNIPAEEFEDAEIYTLTDEDGNDAEFELLAELEDNGITYLAMTPIDEVPGDDEEEYVILKVEVAENGEETVVTIDDDDEFERIADMFDDLFANMD